MSYRKRSRRFVANGVGFVFPDKRKGLVYRKCFWEHRPAGHSNPVFQLGGLKECRTCDHLNWKDKRDETFELVASFRSRGSVSQGSRGTPAPTYPRRMSEKCVAPRCGSGHGHRRGCSMLCLYASGAMTACAAYEVQLLNPCSLTITTGWRDFQNSQPVPRENRGFLVSGNTHGTRAPCLVSPGYCPLEKLCLRCLDNCLDAAPRAL